MEPIIQKAFKQVSCPSCSTVMDCYDKDGSEYFACPSCRTYFYEDNSGQGVVVEKFESSRKFEPVLAIGSNCSFRGKKFIVTGCVQKYEPGEGLRWQEYFLHNNTDEDYHVLARVEGEWNLVWKSKRQDYEVTDGETKYAKQLNPYKQFDHYVSYDFVLEYAIGEFDTNILAESRNLYVEEYLNPPDMLVSERMGVELIWYQGMYVPDEAVEEAFGKSKGYTEANERKADKLPTYYKYGFIMVLFIIFAQIIISAMKPEKVLLNDSFVTIPDTGTFSAQLKPIDAGKIKIASSGSVTFHYVTDVANEWLEIPVTLTNEKTGQTYEFTKVAEYYSGYEGGEHWSEGSNNGEAVLSDVPAGTYQVNIFPGSDIKRNFTVSVYIVQNEVLYSNLFLLILAIAGVPLLWSIGRSFNEYSSNY